MADSQRADYSWRSKRVLITGHTGFIGSWLSLWLHQLGAKVAGYALQPHTDPALYSLLDLEEKLDSSFADICDQQALKKAIDTHQPEVILHLAAQAIVGQAQSDPYESWRVNTLGTAALLEAAGSCESLEALVVYTTDKVYDNAEEGQGFTEQDRIGGFGLYDSSKGAAELAVRAFRYGGVVPQATATIRAGNVIGGGDWSDARLVPDCIRAFAATDAVHLRHPHAIRPWQHVLDLCYATLRFTGALAQNEKLAGGWNIGPEADGLLSAAEIASKLGKVWNIAEPWQCPKESDAYPEAKQLRLNCDKFRAEFNWQPVLDTEETLTWTNNWYQQHQATPNRIADFTLQQIRDFESKLRLQGQVPLG